MRSVRGRGEGWDAGCGEGFRCVWSARCAFGRWVAARTSLATGAFALVSHPGAGRSRAVIADGALHVEEGPLVGQEDRLSGLNRHKRFCRVRVADADGGFVESVPLSVPSKS